jgi:uncharacterized protein YjbI with pentapeptide repeats
MHIYNLHPDCVAVGWVVGQLADSVKPVIPGLTGSFFVKATYKLQPNTPPVAWPEKPLAAAGDRFVGGDPKQGLAYATDFIPYKPRADFAVVGTAHRPPGGPFATFPVRVTVGPIRKEVAVIGPRTWVPQLLFGRPHPSEAGPAESVPLLYAEAWGGPKSRLNPIGKGPDGPDVARLEPGPFAPRRSYRHDPDPSAFGPIPAAWPFRQDRVGTYSKEWAATRWPWLPLDFDWSHYNATAPDQWFDGYLRGDEPLLFENMHPENPVYRSQLPGARPRLFLEQMVRKLGDEVAFREVPLDLDTLWVDMDKEQLVLVWRGRAPVLSTKLKDVKNLLVLLEPLDAPARPLADFEAILQQQISPPPPPAPPAGAPQSAAEAEAAQAKIAAAKRRTEAMEQLTQSLREMAAEKQKIDTMLASYLPQMKEYMGAVKAEAEARGIDVPEPPATLKEAMALAVAKQRETIARLKAMPGVPPEKIAECEALLAKMEATKLPEISSATPQVQKPRPKGEEPFDLERARRGGYVNAILRDRDFSGLDLSGIDFSGTVFAGSKFVGTILKGTILRAANLTKTDLSRAQLNGAVLDFADFGEATLAGASFTKASIASTKLCGLDLTGLDFSGATGMYADFTGSKLIGAVFKEARLPRAIFTKAKVGQVDFSRACLAAANFENTKATGAIFADADLTNFRTGRQADFTGAVFDRIQATGSIWRAAILDGSSFARGKMARALFEDASLKGAVFDRCDLSQASFEDAILEAAILTNANLKNANFAGADLTRARLDGSSLYEAVFRDTELEGATWHNANIKKTRLVLR